MKTTVGILSLLIILTLAGCSSDNNPSSPDAMTVRLAVVTNPIGCATDVFWTSTPDGMSGEMLGMVVAQTTEPRVVSMGTTIAVQGQVNCAVPGSSGAIDVSVEVMVGGDWQEAPMSGTRSCNIAAGPGGCVIAFTSDLS